MIIPCLIIIIIKVMITLDRSPSSRFSLCSSPPLDSHQPTLNQFRSEYDKKKQCEEKKNKIDNNNNIKMDDNKNNIMIIITRSSIQPSSAANIWKPL